MKIKLVEMLMTDNTRDSQARFLKFAVLKKRHEANKQQSAIKLQHVKDQAKHTCRI